MMKPTEEKLKETERRNEIYELIYARSVNNIGIIMCVYYSFLVIVCLMTGSD